MASNDFLKFGDLEFTFMHRAADVVLEMMENVPSREERFQLLLNFIHHVNPDYSQVMNRVCSTPEKRQQMVDDVLRKKWIPLVIGTKFDPIEVIDFVRHLTGDTVEVDHGKEDMRQC